ncbi:MAG: adenylate kinase [Candidatus Omnitrophica bacterium]|nr:adenylate kinase [Candidatus Omnitrophota bacterium]
MTNQSIPAFTIFGPPGCGKGTQAAVIKERLEYLHVSTGDIFRAALAKGDPAALQAKELMERGELVPDETIRDMLVGQLKAILEESSGAKGLILDGFPRTLGQAGMLEDILKQLNLRFTGCVSLKVDEEELVQRLIKRAEIEKRPDDTEEVIRERMRVYQEKTQPLENYFAEKNQLIEVEGLGTIDEVYGRLAPIINRW